MAYTKVKPPTYDKVTMSQFYGADLRNAPSNVMKGRSPSIPNMIRDTKGNNKKRYGYETLIDFGIYGSREYTITAGASVGDTVTIDGITFTAKVSGSDLVFE